MIIDPVNTILEPVKVAQQKSGTLKDFHYPVKVSKVPYYKDVKVLGTSVVGQL